MSNLLTFPFGKVTVHDNYIIVVMNEGIVVTPDFNSVLEDIAKTYFSNKAFVYITHRINSYSVDPNIYFKTSQITNLKGFAVVTGDKLYRDNVALEKTFFSKPFKSFAQLNKAIDWANNLLESN
ncbi:hypothetical protein [Formosa maritima]|uniref:STAS/SEC14 domain-containing protein n=1 Tax=Formosa maritima TaxID=2592046 RepID=A0A5D0GMH4_9FLAO|nr:hypothetical protein [Formosa maritima]TYA58887.1 hypothetical protein FVF61_01685 [Formosa maritima]